MKSRQAEYDRSTAFHYHSDEEAMSLRAPYGFHAASYTKPGVNLNSRLKELKQTQEVKSRNRRGPGIRIFG
jgi:hypothetical protein